jgi:alpha-L-arabinofuranosidase
MPARRRSIRVPIITLAVVAVASAALVVAGPVAPSPGGPDGQDGTAPVAVAITGDATAEGTPISPLLYGLFYEDINHAADGGLYAELVRNRSFEFTLADTSGFHALTAWELVGRGGADGEVEVETDAPLNDRNLHFARLTLIGGDQPGGAVVLRNEGFNTGIHITAGAGYDVSFWARRSGAEEVPIRIAVEDADGTAIFTETATIVVASDDWEHYTVEVAATDTTTAGRLALAIDGATPAGTTLDLDMVSLFPQDTFMGRPNGLRRDLAEMLVDLEPSFLRFPGGCLVNAGSFEPFPHRSRVYNWKDTIGPVEERATNANFWGYNHSYGLGYLEYFLLAKDLGAEPFPVVPAGVNGCAQTHRITDPDELAPWVQDTLDLIEFANGDVDTEWGALRAQLGHPEPFDLKYLGIGNEEYDAQFYANYPYFHDAIRAAHPDINIVSNSGTESGGAVFDTSWEFAREQGADFVDEHYYNSPAWFLGNTHRYDDYDRDGPHVIVGEYASQDNTFWNALAEAAYLTGIERNADVVHMAAYAPLFANAAYVNWAPDLIWFDNHRVYGTTSYYVQRLFSTNSGDAVVPTSLEAAGADDAEPDPITGSIGLGTWDTTAAYSNVRVTAADGLGNTGEGTVTVLRLISSDATGPVYQKTVLRSGDTYELPSETPLRLDDLEGLYALWEDARLRLHRSEGGWSVELGGKSYAVVADNPRKWTVPELDLELMPGIGGNRQLVVRRFGETVVLSQSSAEQASAVLALLNEDPESYRRSVIEAPIS